MVNWLFSQQCLMSNKHSGPFSLRSTTRRQAQGPNLMQQTNFRALRQAQGPNGID